MEVERPSFLQGRPCISRTSGLPRKVHPKQTQSISTTTPICPIRICIAVYKSENNFRTNQTPGKIQGRGPQPPSGSFYGGLQRGEGSHANPAKRFVWEKEEQRNGRGLYAASGGRDEGCGVCSDATPPLPFSFYRQRLFLCRAKKKGLNTAISAKTEKSGLPEAFLLIFPL